MEHFFIEEKFCDDISDLLMEYDIDEEDWSTLEEDWSCKVELSTLEPMFKIDADYIAQMLCDRNEERYTEYGSEHERIVKALNECVDFEKLNAMIPKLYYPNGQFVIITKKDLIEYCE